MPPMRKKRPWQSPWRRKLTPQEWAESRALLSEWFARQPHAPSSPGARDEVIDEPFALIRQAPPVEQPAPGP